MESKESIRVFEVLGSPFAITTEDGEKVYEKINSNLKKQAPIQLDFDQIELVVSTFLNASIGQLYGSYDSEFIKTHLSIVNMTPEDLVILEKVINRAKDFFSNKEGFTDLLKDHFSDGE